MEKAFQKALSLLGERAPHDLHMHFKRVSEMPGASHLFRRMLDSPDEDQLRDYLVEMGYALVFDELGFQVEIEPEGKEGPDLEISRDGHHAVVEVTRFRKVYLGPPEVEVDNLSVLSEYGDPSRDIRKAFNKIVSKFYQVQDRESIIAIWNDDEDLEEVEVQSAVASISEAASRGTLTLPDGLLFILYGTKWRGMHGKQLYCFPVHSPARPPSKHQLTWQQEIEASTWVLS